MGLDLNSGAWGCWRNSSHRGRSPVALVAQLLNISKTQAAKIVSANGETVSYDEDDYADAVRKLLQPDDEVLVSAPELSWPEASEPFSSTLPRHKTYQDYLLARGLSAGLLQRLGEPGYGCRVCQDSEWKLRLLMPLFNERGGLVGWTGRAVTSSALRYKMHPPGGGKPSLFNLPALLERKPKTIVLVEGPMDAVAVDWACRGMDGVVAIASLSTSLTSEQVSILARVVQGSSRLLILYDAGATVQAATVADSLSFLEASVCPPIGGWSDPADAPPKIIREHLSVVLS
jgi:hypothetical protein